MVYRDFFIYTTNYWDFDTGFKITQEIIDVVGNSINGYNFNRYGRYGEGSPRERADPREHITVRLDFDNKEDIQKVEDKLEEMKKQGIIDDWCQEEDNPYNILPMREYPTTYHTAHETSTACAFEFHRKSRESPSKFRNLNQDKVRYLSDFFLLWLKNVGFKLLNNITISTSDFIQKLAKDCASVFMNTVDKSRISDKQLFTDRLLHLFLNCICISREEPQIIVSIGSRLGLVVNNRDSYDAFCKTLGKSFDC